MIPSITPRFSWASRVTAQERSRTAPRTRKSLLLDIVLSSFIAQHSHRAPTLRGKAVLTRELFVFNPWTCPTQGPPLSKLSGKKQQTRGLLVVLWPSRLPAIYRLLIVSQRDDTSTVTALSSRILP